MSEIVLSILIPTLIERRYYLESLLLNLYKQCGPLIEFYSLDETRAMVGVHRFKDVEIIVAMDDRGIPTGTKRNILLEKAKGKYVVGLDDDDKPAEFYVEEIIKGAKSDCDCMGIQGYMTTNGIMTRNWFISKDYLYCTKKNNHGEDEYYRYPNHITPIIREIAIKFKYPDVYQFEDFAWATAIHESGLIKSEYKIDRHPMYYYDFKSK